MKFTSLNQKRLFCVDCGHPEMMFTISSNWEPPMEMVEDFIKKREKEISHLVDFRKSQAAKSAWRRNRYNYMSGIKDFHKSTKGKQMHRKLGNFLATHDFEDSIIDDTMISHLNDREEALDEFCESKIKLNMSSTDRASLLKALSSVKTHLFIESEYYRDMLEETNFRILLNESKDQLDKAESLLLDYEVSMPVHMLEFICRIADPNTVISRYAELTDMDESRIANRFNSIKENINRYGLSEESDGFYTILYNNLKKITMSKSRVLCS